MNIIEPVISIFRQKKALEQSKQTMQNIVVDNDETEKIEIDLMLEAIYQRYGYDFRDYSRATITRRIRNFLQTNQYEKVSELIPQLIHNENFFNQLLHKFSITVTEMFRDPSFYKIVRNSVIQYLKTYPFVKIWHAGCATGEEVYSIAILLKETGLYEKATIFATDFNNDALATARLGIYPIKNIRMFTTNYQKSGGINSFSDYYYADYDSAILNKSLKKRITFANHNLVTDGVFGEMNMVICRNVLIYFNQKLQNRVLNLLTDSLAYKGFLCLGSKETIKYSDVVDKYDVFNEKERIFQKKHFDNVSL